MFNDAVSQKALLPLDLITLLTQMALGSNASLAEDATQSLYGKIILPLCDDFTSSSVDIANQVLISMIQAFCHTSQGQEARQILNDFHLDTPESFLSRYKDLTRPRGLSEEDREQIKKVFILSRVTLGADIAITSLILSQCKDSLPNAKIHLVGPDHLRHLFHDESVKHLLFPYDRDWSLLEKMAAWPKLFKLISKETKSLAPKEILLFDPDTRLSQLGLLPLAPTSSTFYFCSRKDQTDTLSLPEITNSWLKEIFPDTSATIPHCHIKAEVLDQCQRVLSHSPPNTFKIFINFGVGNDTKKRLPDPFEEELLSALLYNKETLIILDSGKGTNEEERAKRLMAKIAEMGYKTAELGNDNYVLNKIDFDHGVVRFTGKIDSVVGLVRHSDLFIGYDSCGQHLATSTETPTIICFAGAPNKRFLERWQPGNHHGKTTTLIIDHNPLSSQKRSQLIDKIVNTAALYRP